MTKKNVKLRCIMSMYREKKIIKQLILNPVPRKVVYVLAGSPPSRDAYYNNNMVSIIVINNKNTVYHGIQFNYI